MLLFQPAEERHSARNPMGGAIRMIRDRAAGEELCRELGVTVVTRPEAEPTVGLAARLKSVDLSRPTGRATQIFPVGD